MDGPSPPGLEPFKNLKRPNGSITPNWVGFMPPQKVRMASGSGWIGKAGSGPVVRHGPTSGSMIPDPGSTSRKVVGMANQSFSTSPAKPGDKPKKWAGKLPDCNKLKVLRLLTPKNDKVAFIFYFFVLFK